MSKLIWTVAATAVAFSGAALAAEKTDMDGAKTASGKVVADYFKMHFTECNPTGAQKKFYAEKAVEHGWLGMMGNAGMGAGAPPAGAAPQGGAGAPPAGAGAPPAGAAPQGAPGMGGGEGMTAGGKCEPIADMIKIITQGDLVFVQAHGHTTKPNGDLLWILYRVKDGKITEHWDTHDAIPDSQAGKQW
jgi:hypothetical protein